jgi:lysophospholipid acyltransferase (LPLAT)-like uncharacterized protein
VPLLAATLIRLIYATMRVRWINVEAMNAMHRQGQLYVLTLWHGQLLLMCYAGFKRPLTVMISQHRDGELIALTLRKFGVTAARGSTTRGGLGALRTMLQLAKEGHNLAFTPDGPRGPRHVAQPGVVAAAQLTGLPILPVAFVAKRKKLLRSWDRFEIPHLFSRGLFHFGTPIAVPRRLTDEEMEAYRLQVEETLNNLSDEAERDFDRLYNSTNRGKPDWSAGRSSN